jgi:predicted ATPase
MRNLETIAIQNFKSIRDQRLDLGRLNVFIGGNGSGKSNLIQVFRLLREITLQNLATYSLERTADSLLHFGRKKSPYVELFVQFGDGQFGNAYRIRLAPTDEGAFVVSQETVYFHDRGTYPTPYNEIINSGSKEAIVGTSENKIAGYVRRDLDTYRIYHFHDTSDSAPVKASGPVEDNRFLRPDASNLAAFLYYLQQRQPDHFRNIEDAVRQIAPFFEAFNLEPSRLSPDKIRVEWKEKGSDAYFNASSLSDGTLRFMCLATLLLQPTLPAVVLLDEPELGLHPAAIALLADLLASAATRTQVLVATQSVTLVNQFEPEQVWTVERQDGASVFHHLSNQDMSAWLDEYALGELWEKNVLGARP